MRKSNFEIKNRLGHMKILYAEDHKTDSIEDAAHKAGYTAVSIKVEVRDKSELNGIPNDSFDK